MVVRQLVAACLPLLFILVGVSQALTATAESESAVIEMRTSTGHQSISVSVEEARVVDGLLQDLADALQADDSAGVQRLIRQLDDHGIHVDVPPYLVHGDVTLVSNRLCVMYGYFSKALFSYPLDLAVAGLLSLFNGFATIGLFLLWSVLTHALHPVHLVSPLIFLTILDGATGQLVTRGLEGTQVISADDLSTHFIFGFVGTIINVIVPVQDAPDPAFCLGAALAITPAP